MSKEMKEEASRQLLVNPWVKARRVSEIQSKRELWNEETVKWMQEMSSCHKVFLKEEMKWKQEKERCSGSKRKEINSQEIRGDRCCREFSFPRLSSSWRCYTVVAGESVTGASIHLLSSQSLSQISSRFSFHSIPGCQGARQHLLMSAAQRFLTQRIIPLKEKKSRAEVEREVDGVRKEKERLTAAIISCGSFCIIKQFMSLQNRIKKRRMSWKKIRYT